MSLEKAMREKEEKYAREKGGKYMKRDDFRQYAANLRVKNANFKVMKKVLDEIKGEVVVLKRTETILKQRTENVDAFMKELEQKQGIQGYSNVEDQIQGFSELKERLDNAKSKSLEELNQLIQQIESEVKDKKNRLAPEIKKLRTLRTRYSEIEKVHNEKKKIYDQVSSTIEMERERIDKDIGTLFKEYKESESKFH